MKDEKTTQTRRGLAGKLPQATESVDQIVDLFAFTLCETFVYFIWYFYAPFAFVFLLRIIPVIRLIPSPVLAIFGGGLSQLTWMRFLTFGRVCQVDQLAAQVTRSPANVNHALLVSQLLGVVIGCWCLGVSWTFIQTLDPTIALIANMPKMPQFKPLYVPEFGEWSWLSGGLESVLAAIATEFAISFLHSWGLGLVAVSRNRVSGVSPFRCFVTPAFVAVGKLGLGYRPSINSSVALIAAFREPRDYAGLFCLAATDVLASVLVIAVPRYFRRRAAYKETAMEAQETQETETYTKETETQRPRDREGTAYFKTGDKNVQEEEEEEESTSTMPSATAVESPLGVYTRRQRKLMEETQ